MYQKEVALQIIGRAIQDYVIAGSDDFGAVRDSVELSCKVFNVKLEDYKAMVLSSCRMIIGLTAKNRSASDVAVLRKILEDRRVGDARKMMNQEDN